MDMIVKVKKLKEQAVMPKRATEGSAGADLYACIDEPITIAPGQLVKIPTGIAIELSDSHTAAFLFARSGLGVKHGITLSNGVKVICNVPTYVTQEDVLVDCIKPQMEDLSKKINEAIKNGQYTCDGINEDEEV